MSIHSRTAPGPDHRERVHGLEELVERLRSEFPLVSENSIRSTLALECEALEGRLHGIVSARVVVGALETVARRQSVLELTLLFERPDLLTRGAWSSEHRDIWVAESGRSYSGMIERIETTIIRAARTVCGCGLRSPWPVRRRSSRWSGSFTSTRRSCRRDDRLRPL